VHTKDVYDPVTESSPLFAIDCEMVGAVSCICCCCTVA